jgi:rSAM/selenodomain-associated transferase 1
MTRRPVVIVFLRAPEIGAVKRRLAAGIGMEAARRFYVETTQRLLRRLAADPHWDLVLAVTPDRAATQGRYWPPSLRRLPQRQGDLGVRMERALLRFPTRPVLLIGSDVPAIGRQQIRDAFSALGRCDLVFGPATDGGYWLVGARNTEMVRGLFRNIRWSGPHALADTLANAGNRRLVLLESLEDIDDAGDLSRWRAAHGA